MNRIPGTFERVRRERRAGVVIYLTVGFPSIEETVSLAKAALTGGADILELGVPFSDPLADGTTIQHASAVALALGVNLQTCLDVAARIRNTGTPAPILLMGYYNPFLQYGAARLAAASQAAGVDGFIIPDLPPEEASVLDNALQPNGLDIVYLLAPTSTDARLQAVAAQARGLIYCVSLTGVTGARNAVSPRAFELLERVRRHSSLPLAVGFGISGPEHVRALAPSADAIVVASALLDLIEKTPQSGRAAAVEAFVRSLVAASRRASVRHAPEP